MKIINYNLETGDILQIVTWPYKSIEDTPYPNGIVIDSFLNIDDRTTKVDVDTKKLIPKEPDIPDPQKQWEIITDKRTLLLQETDWTQLPDVPEKTKLKWKDYRQALRDITKQPDPYNIDWPESHQ